MSGAPPNPVGDPSDPVLARLDRTTGAPCFWIRTGPGLVQQHAGTGDPMGPPVSDAAALQRRVGISW